MNPGVLDELVGNFWGDSTYSEFPSLSPELSADVTSLAGSAGNLDVAAGTSVVCAQFEFILPLPMSAGVVVL